MDVLFLSSLCSTNEYERMFELYKSTSSHASQKFNRLFVNGLVENGCNVEALTKRIIFNYTKEERNHEDEEENGIHYTYLPVYKRRFVDRIKTMWKTFRYVKKWQKKHPDGYVICDIILGEMSIGVWLASKFSKINSTAIVTDVPSIRAGGSRKGIKSIPVKIKNSMIAKYKSYVFLTEQMNVKLNPKNRPYAIIEGLVDDTIVNNPNLPENKYPEKTVMMAGLLRDIYGVDMLVDAFKEVDCPEARLKFYGKGASVKKIEEASSEDSRISYCGELTNQQIVEEEKKCTVLINPRPPIGEWTAYSFPSKNMEYMASGTPLVAFDLPCIPEEYKQYFYMIPEYTKDCIKTFLENILKSDSMEIHEFGIKAQSWIVDNKNPKAQIKKFLDVIS